MSHLGYGSQSFHFSQTHPGSDGIRIFGNGEFGRIKTKLNYIVLLAKGKAFQKSDPNCN